MTTFGDQLFHMGGVPIGGLITQGDIYHLKPSNGNDSHNGKSLDAAIKTLSQAHTLISADQQDTVYMYAEDNSASGTTDYLSATLTWSKDGTRLIGVNSGGMVGQRSRIAQLSTATGCAPLITFSANNCFVSNIHIFHGVADANSIGALNVTGSRNHFYRCHIAGIGNATQDVANNYSLQISGGAENLFEDCVIGLDTIARGTAANSELRLASGATRNIFRNCIFPTYAEAAGHQFLLVPVNGLDRWNLFENCLFVNMPTGTASGTTMTEAFDVTGGGSPDGLLILKNCTLIGATDWEANTESAKTYIDGGAPTNNTSGLAVLVEAT